MIFSADWLIAGTVDLFCKRPDGKYIIGDWKTNEKLSTEGFNRQTMMPPIETLQDCNMTHYALQMSLYELILRREGHIAPGNAVTDRWIIHIPPNQSTPIWIPMPDYKLEAIAMVYEHCCQGFKAIPF